MRASAGRPKHRSRWDRATLTVTVENAGSSGGGDEVVQVLRLGSRSAAWTPPVQELKSVPPRPV